MIAFVVLVVVIAAGVVAWKNGGGNNRATPGSTVPGVSSTTPLRPFTQVLGPADPVGSVGPTAIGPAGEAIYGS